MNMKFGKKGIGDIVWPEIVRMVLIWGTVIIVLSLIYLWYRGVNFNRGLL